ncbi:MAG: hypothetical protein L0Y44_07935 [Phycisphaerales bacterium]|nr:hypothetical protein [Phycisphaerales bacterium]MCI0630564.1 hypothetical protein [Phycisphaerales bacterium]MCI0675999.1 hypothetical protein [Phycisphaerales bacterium]
MSKFDEARAIAGAQIATSVSLPVQGQMVEAKSTSQPPFDLIKHLLTGRPLLKAKSLVRR